MKTSEETGTGDHRGKVIGLSRRQAANAAALEVLRQVTAWVEAHPEAASLVVLVGSPGRCQPFSTPIDRPLEFIGMLELMKHDLFREK